MAADDPGLEEHEEALGKQPTKPRKNMWFMLAGALGVSAVAAIVLWAGAQSEHPAGEPVVVLKLPPQKTAPPPTGKAAGGSPIRKSIDPDKPRMKAALNPEDERPLQPVKPSEKPPSPLPGQDPAPKRDNDAPPGMTTARIIDPSLPPSGSARPPFRKLDALTKSSLRARTAYGLVPVVGKNGLRPADAYARRPARRPMGDQAAKARIALVIGGMGISSEGTHIAINRLPPDVTLAFAPYGSALQSLADKARRDGHELMLQLPMEPFDYPDNDPGPKTMLTGLPPSENIKRLQWLSSRFTGFFGVTNYMGTRFTTSGPALKPVLNWIGEHGLVYLDDGNSPRSLAKSTGRSVGLNVVQAHEVIDHGQTAASIRAALKRLEIRALEDGLAIGVGTGLPLTVSLVTAWSKSLKERGIMLVPVSSTFQNQKS